MNAGKTALIALVLVCVAVGAGNLLTGGADTQAVPTPELATEAPAPVNPTELEAGDDVAAPARMAAVPERAFVKPVRSGKPDAADRVEGNWHMVQSLSEPAPGKIVAAPPAPRRAAPLLPPVTGAAGTEVQMPAEPQVVARLDNLPTRPPVMLAPARPVVVAPTPSAVRAVLASQDGELPDYRGADERLENIAAQATETRLEAPEPAPAALAMAPAVQAPGPRPAAVQPSQPRSEPVSPMQPTVMTQSERRVPDGASRSPSPDSPTARPRLAYVDQIVSANGIMVAQGGAALGSTPGGSDRSVPGERPAPRDQLAGTSDAEVPQSPAGDAKADAVPPQAQQTVRLAVSPGRAQTVPAQPQAPVSVSASDSPVADPVAAADESVAPRYVELVARMDGKYIGRLVVRIDGDQQASVRVLDMIGPMRQTVASSMFEALVSLETEDYVSFDRLRNAGIGVDYESAQGEVNFAMTPEGANPHP